MLPGLRGASGLFESTGLCDGWELQCGNMGALITRTGFWGTLYCSYTKEPPQSRPCAYVGGSDYKRHSDFGVRK